LGFSDIEVIDPRFPSGPWCEDHGDACQVDPSARVVARNDFSLQAAVWGSHLGVQFHPEVDAEQLREWQGVEVPQSPRALTMSNMIAQAEQQPDDLRRRAALLVDYFESL
jgi:GMP synthase-like glutamine amidotransferase